METLSLELVQRVPHVRGVRSMVRGWPLLSNRFPATSGIILKATNDSSISAAFLVRNRALTKPANRYDHSGNDTV